MRGDDGERAKRQQRQMLNFLFFFLLCAIVCVCAVHSRVSIRKIHWTDSALRNVLHVDFSFLFSHSLSLSFFSYIFAFNKTSAIFFPLEYKLL